MTIKVWLHWTGLGEFAKPMEYSDDAAAHAAAQALSARLGDEGEVEVRRGLRCVAAYRDGTPVGGVAG